MVSESQVHEEQVSSYGNLKEVGAPSQKDGCILIIDDSEMQLKSISYQLSKAGYQTIECQDPRKAMDFVLEKKPDIIISDYFMPDINGMDLGKAVKSNRETSHIYFIMLTANNKQSDRYKALNTFADDYLQKPISPSELLARVNSTMRLVRLQRELKQRNTQLEKAIRDLEKANLELKETQAQMLQQEKMASIGLLAAGVAHEINNPICFIDMNLGVIGEYIQPLEKIFAKIQECQQSMPKRLPATARNEIQALQKMIEETDVTFLLNDIKNIVKESREGSERVKAIVQNLRDFSHVDQTERKYANIHDGIESTLNIAWNEIKYKAHVIKEYGNVPEVLCYPRQLNQVFLNMIINAVHAIQEKGEIRLKTWNDKKHVYISISDTGCGIPPENLSKIFEPFFTTKPVGKGTGLGLAMSYNIIQKHGGDILVESEVGKGTTFTIKLPIDGKKENGD